MASLLIGVVTQSCVERHETSTSPAEVVQHLLRNAGEDRSADEVALDVHKCMSIWGPYDEYEISVKRLTMTRGALDHDQEFVFADGALVLRYRSQGSGATSTLSSVMIDVSRLAHAQRTNIQAEVGSSSRYRSASLIRYAYTNDVSPDYVEVLEMSWGNWIRFGFHSTDVEVITAGMGGM